MSYFDIGIIILFIAAAIYYIVFFSLIFYWHEKRTSYVVVPLLFSFQFFLIGFLIVAAVSIILENLPEIINLLTS